MKIKTNNINEILSLRIEKIDRIKDQGYLPYPYSYKKTHDISDIFIDHSKYENKNISIAGRIRSQRKMGKASFINIQDVSGNIQIYLKNDLLPENVYDDIVRSLDIGDIIGTSGTVFLTKTNEISIKASSITLLAKSIRPMPNLKQKEGVAFNSFDNKELRYRHRQLDLIANPDIKNIFICRAKIISSIRKYLDNHKFIEVETPALQPVYGGASARPFKTFHNSLDQSYYLRIADELYLKRLIIGGFEKVYEIAKNFRNEGVDKNHNPEFTSLEFYEAYADVYDMMNITEDLIKDLLKTLKKLNVKYFNESIDYNKDFEKFSMEELFVKYCGKNLLTYSFEEIYEFARINKIDNYQNMNYGQILDKIFSKIIEPKLIRPTFVYDYPISISPLAKNTRENKTDIVERFELFISGMEIANSFTELNDPIEQRKRFEDQKVLKDQGDEEAQIIDENFLQAMEYGMPPTGGVGIGIDRLVMILTGQSTIKDVILFPALRQEI